MNIFFKKNSIHFQFRGFLLLLFFVFIIGILFYRLIYLHITDQNFLLTQSSIRTVRTVSIPANRGMILDRNNEPMAVSTEIESLWINPQKYDQEKLSENQDKLKKIAKLIDQDYELLLNKITQKKKSGKAFVYLKRHLLPTVSEEIIKVGLPGLYLKKEYKRFYPGGEVNAHVLGFTDIDDNGQEGLELTYNKWLTGVDGKKKIIQDALGRVISDLSDIETLVEGKDVVLSIEQKLQFLAYKELKKTIKKHNAVSGSAVVLDVETGEVLTMVNFPSFNPNLRSMQDYSANYRNLSVTDYFEPGSVFKSFSAASVLESGNFDLTTKIDTSPGILKLNGGIVRDPHNFGEIDLATILKRSSNIGISKLVIQSPAEHLWDMYDRLGFGSKTGSGFPGESSGILKLPNNNREFVLATMSFGYGVAVTPLQLARAYAIFGAGGIRRPTTFVKTNEPVAGVRVVSEKVSRQVVSLLTDLANQKKSRASVPGYQVAGKTGTSRKLGPDGYEKGKHRAVFAGLAPAVNPKFSIVVTVDEPKSGQYYGNVVAAPVFSRIALEALRLFNIPPDVSENNKWD